MPEQALGVEYVKEAFDILNTCRHILKDIDQNIANGTISDDLFEDIQRINDKLDVVETLIRKMNENI